MVLNSYYIFHLCCNEWLTLNVVEATPKWVHVRKKTFKNKHTVPLKNDIHQSSFIWTHFFGTQNNNIIVAKKIFLIEIKLQYSLLVRTVFVASRWSRTTTDGLNNDRSLTCEEAKIFLLTRKSMFFPPFTLNGSTSTTVPATGGPCADHFRNLHSHTHTNTHSHVHTLSLLHTYAHITHAYIYTQHTHTLAALVDVNA